MKGNKFLYNCNDEGLKLKPGTIIKLTHSRTYPQHTGTILMRLGKNYSYGNHKNIAFVSLKNAGAFSTIKDFKWEIIREI